MQGIYRDVTRDANFFAGTAAIAILLACMGLVGIAVSTAERRTKEIGVRKAMGADNRQIVALLLWQFAQPVLWANVIAWPVAWWLMRRWLSGFAYHIGLHWWVFAGTSLGALGVALVTVAARHFSPRGRSRCWRCVTNDRFCAKSASDRHCATTPSWQGGQMTCRRDGVRFLATGIVQQNQLAAY